VHLEELSPGLIWVIHDFASSEECDHFIAAGEAIGFADAPITTAAGFVMDRDIRDNTRVMVDDHALAEMLWERARPFLPAKLAGMEACGFNERFRYYRYDVGQRFAPHLDGYFARDNGERSLLTFMVYLNDDFEGGETNFFTSFGGIRVSVRPRKGMALVFRHQQLHEGAPVTSGRKYVLRTDVMYRAPAS